MIPPVHNEPIDEPTAVMLHTPKSPLMSTAQTSASIYALYRDQHYRLWTFFHNLLRFLKKCLSLVFVNFSLNFFTFNKFSIVDIERLDFFSHSRLISNFQLFFLQIVFISSYLDEKTVENLIEYELNQDHISL